MKSLFKLIVIRSIDIKIILQNINANYGLFEKNYKI